MSKYLKTDKKCNYPKCPNKYYGNGLCGIHYRMCRYDKYKSVRKYLKNKDIKIYYTKTYASYMNMIQRCYNPKNMLYSYYGGRGIKVCDRWLESFDNFLNDMGERPAKRTLDRINVNGNYKPSNCRWSTRLVQSRNRRNVVKK